jgi:hypothetical protein
MKYGLVHIALLLPCLLFGQKLSVRISDSTLLIGEPVTITYMVETQKNDSIYFQPAYRKLDASLLTRGGSVSNEKIELEILQDFDTTLRKGKNLQLWKGSYTLTCWDSGWVLLQGPRIVINDSTFHFADLRFTSSFTKHEKGTDLYDIRENYAEIPVEYFPYSEYILKHWYWAAPLLLFVIILWILWRRRRRRRAAEEAPEPKKMVSLKVRTILAIEALEKEKLWERDRLKDHFVELSYILRSYLTARYSVSLLEKTTYETRLILQQKGLEKETIEVIVLLLSQSDMVKFAKSNPDVLAILRVSTQAKQVVAETSPLEFDNVE